ncbi:MAG TPA: ribbon-helix-helix domain-containing protein [Methanomassiliicoccales archaeon]|nr:ribbon-helix-helix domain-containing protein [Methanomassiliicoccales archaeon]
MGRGERKEDERISIVSDLHNKGEDLISDMTRTGEGVAVNVRLPKGLVTGIDGWVDEDIFRSRSDFILAATRHYLYYLVDKDIRPSCRKDDQRSK